MLGINFRFGGCLFLTFSLAIEILGRQRVREGPQPATETQPTTRHDFNIQQFRERGHFRAVHLSGYPTLGFIIQVIVVTFVILLAGEIIPKLYANRSQLNMVIFMAGPLTFLSRLFRPLSALLIGSTSIISKRMDKKDNLSIDQLSKALELTKDTAINEEKDILEGDRH